MIISKGGVYLYKKNNTYKFELYKLPYGYDSLEPYIDSETLYEHHIKYLKKYIDNLNDIISSEEELKTFNIKKLISYSNKLSEKIKYSILQNACGIYIHNLYFEQMAPYYNCPGEPTGVLKKSIIKYFRSFEKFKNIFYDNISNINYPSCVWLITDHTGKLNIIRTSDLNTPLNDNFEYNNKINPILVCDLWEHAYFLKHKSNNLEYVKNWFKVVNWDKVQDKYIKSIISFKSQNNINL